MPARPAPRPPTLAVVARHAGVSVPTVSKVLRGRAGVAPETRERVNLILDSLGYPRTSDGQAQLGSALIDVVIPKINTTWSAKLLTAIDEEATRQGFSIVLTSLREPQKRSTPPYAWIEQVARRGTAGIFGVMVEFSDTQVDYIVSNQLPCCVLSAFNQPAGITGLRVLNFEAERRATQHLIELGHRRIAMISGLEQSIESDQRVDGYTAALREANIELDPSLLARGDFTAEGGARATEQVLSVRPPPTAIVFASDKMALAGLGVLARQEIHVPSDMSIIGFDDTDDCALASPPLTTMAQPVEALTRAGIEVLTNSVTDVREVELPAELILRASTAAPPAR